MEEGLAMVLPCFGSSEWLHGQQLAASKVGLPDQPGKDAAIFPCSGLSHNLDEMWSGEVYESGADSKGSSFLARGQRAGFPI